MTGTHAKELTENIGNRCFKVKVVNARKLAHGKFPESLFPAGADSAP